MSSFSALLAFLSLCSSHPTPHSYPALSFDFFHFCHFLSIPMASGWISHLPSFIQLETRTFQLKHFSASSRILQNPSEDSVASSQDSLFTMQWKFSCSHRSPRAILRNLSWRYNPWRFSLKTRRRWWENIP